jgi:hypothetical protein
LGVFDVDALLQAMSSKQIVEWMAYYDLEPFGEERADFRAAMLASLYANSQRDPKKQKPFEMSDFMLFRDREAEEDESDALKSKAEMLNEMFGGIDKRVT